MSEEVVFASFIEAVMAKNKEISPLIFFTSPPLCGLEAVFCSLRKCRTFRGQMEQIPFFLNRSISVKSMLFLSEMYFYNTLCCAQQHRSYLKQEVQGHVISWPTCQWEPGVKLFPVSPFYFKVAPVTCNGHKLQVLAPTSANRGLNLLWNGTSDIKCLSTSSRCVT